MIVLGIESSCDETAAAVVDDGRQIRSSRVLSQDALHRPFGGVVPEVAARAHLSHVDRLVGDAMREAKLSFADLDGIAGTAGPGLIGGVMVGLTTAKAIALVTGKPLIAVNHLEAHALTARLSHGIDFPYLLALVTGGHCQLLIIEDVGRYRLLGTTIDDAVGEAFDKAAKLLGLGYPGGPALEGAARRGDATRYSFPRPLKGRPGCDFSFAGLKSALARTLDALREAPTATDIADLAASFQAAITDVLAERTAHAIEIFRTRHSGCGSSLVVAGGVAANQTVRSRLASLAEAASLSFVAPPAALCTDNAAMVAWAGIERLRRGLSDGLDVPARPRWPLDPTASRGLSA
jgi:N6-L-threonylcarbamoyladenine synthase